MKTFLQRQLTTLLLLGWGFCEGPATYGQNAPLLSITAPAEPQISVQGSQGANYQLQYASNLNAVVWHSLTNFTMGSGPFAFTDHAAVSNQIRLYRVLLLGTNVTVGYAPEQLSAAEVFQFIFTPMPAISATETLVLNSPTNALFLRQTMQPGVRPPVEIQYQKASAFSAQLTVIQASSAFPTSQTNYYSLFFTGPNTGFYQTTDGMMILQTGQFTRNQSLIGQQLAPSQLTVGQIFQLAATNTNPTNLVVNSSSAGVLVRRIGLNSILTSAELRYERLGPLACQLDVILTAGFPGPQTNSYWLVYSTAVSGTYQILSPTLSSGLGTFSRADGFVGQQIAPLQLEAGEIYQLTPDVLYFSTNKTSLVLNSSTDALLIVPSSNPTDGGVFPVNIQYSVSGPLNSQLDVVYPPTTSYPSPRTNRYAFLYSSTNGGTYQFSDSLGNSIGTFTRDRSLFGQSIASGALTSGEVYSLRGSNNNNATVGGAVLVMNSPNSGSLSWLPPSSSIDAGIFPANVQYTLLGPLSARLEVVTIPPGGNAQPQTNICYLAFLSTNGGSSQGLINQLYSPSGFGSFIRDRSLIGQPASSTQLVAGEIYEFILTFDPNPALSNTVTLVVTSATNGLAFWQAPNIFFPEWGGLSPVTLSYSQLGPHQCQLEIVFPATDTYPSPQTNVCSFVYSTTNNGLLQVTNSPQLTGGTFRRNLTLVGQQLAPLQLTAGESYQIGTSNNNPSTVSDTLLLDSSNTGVLFTLGYGPNSGIFSGVTLSYSWVNNLSAQITAVIPPLPPALETRTNSYWFIYTATNAGLVKRVSTPTESTFGRFQRQPSQ